MRVAILPIPSNRSDGIHDTVVMLCSIRMPTSRSVDDDVGVHCASWRSTTPGRCPARGSVAGNTPRHQPTPSHDGARSGINVGMGVITVFLADDSVFIREGVKA